MILFHVRREPNTIFKRKSHVFVMAEDRETAKRFASRTLLGDSDQFIVEPLTNPGDVLHFHLQASTQEAT